MKCRKCGAEVEEGSRFCSKCGAEISSDTGPPAGEELVCLSCKATAPPGTEKCPECGSIALVPRSIADAQEAGTARKASTGGLILVFLLAAVFLGVIGAVSVGAAAPGVQRLAGPLVCMDGYKKAVVVIEKSNPRPGQTVMTSEFYCIDDQGKPYLVSTFKVMAVLAVGLSAVFFVMALIGAAGLGIARKVSGPGSGRETFSANKPIG